MGALLSWKGEREGKVLCPEGPHLGLCCPGPYQVSLTLQQVTQPLSLIFLSHPTLPCCLLSLCSQAAGRAHPFMQGRCLNRAGQGRQGQCLNKADQGRLVRSDHTCPEGMALGVLLGTSQRSGQDTGQRMSFSIPLLPGAEANGQHRAVLEISASIGALHLPVEEGLDSESPLSLPHSLVAGEAPAWHREQP